jgi:tetratricopeptide (TPR) repeat protein
MYYYNRAFALIQMGDIEGAISDYRQVLLLKPDDEVTKKQLKILLDNSTLK